MISIVIPIYNAEKTLQQTLDSCYNSTYKNFEIIAVDDQSTDNTNTIIWSNKDHLRIFNTKDINKKGIVAALNLGISEAKGDFIARLDADDYIHPRRLEKQISEFLKNPELLLCSTDAFIIDENGINSNYSILSAQEINELDFKCCIVHPSVMFKKDFFVTHNLQYDPEFEYCEDYDLWMRLRNVATGNYYKRIEEPLLYYRVNNKERISCKHSDIQKQKSKEIRKKYNIKPYLSIINLGDENLLRKEVSNRDFNYEIISPNEEPQGKFIAYSKYENLPNRFEAQIQFLNKYKNFVGCGTFIDTGKNSFFYSPDPDIIENELLKGKIASEQTTFLYRHIIKYNPTDSYFDLLCNLLSHGMVTNLQQPLVKIENYSGIKNSDLRYKIEKARNAYKEIINIVQINITTEGNFSGVDRYLKTLEENYPPNVRCKRITFRASMDKLAIDSSDRDHIIIYYNTNKTQFEHLFDVIWDYTSYMFLNKRNLIVQSNCLNLFSLLTWLRRKVNFKHICMLHCVPYREVIRTNRDEYAKLEALFLDETKEFPEIPWHYDAINLSDHVILNTKDAENYYNRVGYSAPYSIISNGIEKIGNGYKEYKEGPFKFIFVGHSSPLKGLPQLLDVFNDVNKKYPIEIHWAGNTDPEILQIIHKKKLPIKSYGVLNPEDLNRLYQEVNCALIATACETCSYAAIEALSAELPIIATAAHGVKEIVENVGLLVEMNIRAEINKEMYKDAMIKVITDENLRREMSKRSAEKYKEYSKEKLLEDSINLYKNLLNS